MSDGGIGQNILVVVLVDSRLIGSGFALQITLSKMLINDMHLKIILQSSYFCLNASCITGCVVQLMNISK